MADPCTLDDVLACVSPGESCSYADLLERLRAAGRSTWGVGFVLLPFTEPAGQPHNWLLGDAAERQPHGELRCWMRDRYWDDEVAGTWSSSTLWIARRPARG